MKEATLVYPHQLFKKSPALDKKRTVYLIEEPLFLTHNPIHRQKLVFHKLSFDSYEKTLLGKNFSVKRLSIKEYPKTENVFKFLKSEGVEKIHVVDTTDCYLEKNIADSGLERIWYESPLFILEKTDSIQRYKNSKRFMASFYKKLRQDKNILISEDATPVGGKWSFDEENRKKIPKTAELPEDITFFGNTDMSKAEQWMEDLKVDAYGETGGWLPYTHASAEKFLQNFPRARLKHFGTYEDAMTTRGVRLWHSALSPLLNIGLLTPQHVLGEALDYAKENDVPINSLEGFVRQILGWREFIRASYECEGVEMRTKNFWQHKRKLPKEFWTGETGVLPVDEAIKKALQFGYNHHIERLMILGNFMLLNKIDPDDVYCWFMSMYVDAYDWVMVPNVYGMSQFADGGLFATKPYISGSNYIKKMSDYEGGDWEEIWTALYWNFIAENKGFFKSNHRLSMMPRLLEKMAVEKRKKYLETANKYLDSK